MQTIFAAAGRKIELLKNKITITDSTQGPTVVLTWVMSPEEMCKVGIGFIKASGYSFAKVIIKGWNS